MLATLGSQVFGSWLLGRESLGRTAESWVSNWWVSGPSGADLGVLSAFQPTATTVYKN